MLGQCLKLVKAQAQNAPKPLLCSGSQYLFCLLDRKPVTRFSLAGIFSWSMGSGPVKGFNNEKVQEIITKKHDPAQNKIGKEDSQTATFAAGLSMSSLCCVTSLTEPGRMFLGGPAGLPESAGGGEQHGGLHRRPEAPPHLPGRL